MAWEIRELTFGWPPNVTLVRTPGDEEPLDGLFIFLADKRLLLYGYGPSAGINDLDDLGLRIDDIRNVLVPTVKKLGSKAPIAEWLGKLSSACHELLTTTYRAMNATDETARNPEPSVVAPAVDQLRQAFRLVANHVWAVYKLPAARNLAAGIGEDGASPPTAVP